MNKLKQYESPPFYATIYATPTADLDRGLYGEAFSTIISLAAMHTGFLGFEDETDSHGCPVKVAYWETYNAMNTWLEKARELVPHKIDLDNCLGPCGCLWQWLEQGSAEHRNVA